MCVSCENGGFHQEKFTDKRALLQSDYFTSAVLDRYKEDGAVKIHINKESFGEAKKPVMKYIKSLIKEIDLITGTRIHKVNNRGVADITVENYLDYSTDPVTAKYDDSTMGVAFISEGLSHATTANKHILSFPRLKKNGKLSKKHRDITDSTKRLIAHELLHALGLSHPNNVGSEEGFDNSETTMSYNNRHLWNGLTPLDKAAVAALW